MGKAWDQEWIALLRDMAALDARGSKDGAVRKTTIQPALYDRAALTGGLLIHITVSHTLPSGCPTVSRRWEAFHDGFALSLDIGAFRAAVVRLHADLDRACAPLPTYEDGEAV